MNKLLLVALEEEFDKDLLPEDWQVVYTGVGKVNACLHVCESIGVFQPDIVVNYGTAGGLNGASGLLEMKAFVQRDMIAEPLCERGYTPGETGAIITTSAGVGIGNVCATGDSFVTQEDPWLTSLNVDCVDMEGYALAKVCKYADIPFRSWKFISDNADENASDDWDTNAGKGQMQFLSEVIVGEFGSVRRFYH